MYLERTLTVTATEALMSNIDLNVLACLTEYYPDLTLDTIFRYITLASKLKDDILLVQPAAVPPDIAPDNLPPSVSTFLENSCKISASCVSSCWEIVAAASHFAYSRPALPFLFETQGTSGTSRSHVGQLKVMDVYSKRPRESLSMRVRHEQVGTYREFWNLLSECRPTCDVRVTLKRLDVKLTRELKVTLRKDTTSRGVS